jgi:hypothetical protein
MRKHTDASVRPRNSDFLNYLNCFFKPSASVETVASAVI